MADVEIPRVQLVRNLINFTKKGAHVDEQAVLRLIEQVDTHDFLYNQNAVKLFDIFERKLGEDVIVTVVTRLVQKFRSEINLPLEKLLKFIDFMSKNKIAESEAGVALVIACLGWVEELLAALRPQLAFEKMLQRLETLLSFVGQSESLAGPVRSVLLRSVFHHSLVPLYESVLLILTNLERPAKRARSESGSVSKLGFPKLFFEMAEACGPEVSPHLHVCFDSFLAASELHYKDKHVHQSSASYVNLKTIQKQRKAEQRRNDVAFQFYAKLMSTGSTGVIDKLLQERLYVPRLDQDETKKAQLQSQARTLLDGGSWKNLAGILELENSVLDDLLPQLFGTEPSGGGWSGLFHTLFDVFTSRRQLPRLLEQFCLGEYAHLEAIFCRELESTSQSLTLSQVVAIWNLCLENLVKMQNILNVVLKQILVSQVETETLWELAKETRKRKDAISWDLLTTCHAILSECAPRLMKSSHEKLLKKDVKRALAAKSNETTPFLAFYLQYYSSSGGPKLEEVCDALWAQDQSWRSVSLVIPHCSKGCFKAAVKWSKRNYSDFSQASPDIFQSPKFQKAIIKKLGVGDPDLVAMVLALPEGFPASPAKKVAPVLEALIGSRSERAMRKLVRGCPKATYLVDLSRVLQAQGRKLYGWCLRESLELERDEAWLLDNLPTLQAYPEVLSFICGIRFSTAVKGKILETVAACLQGKRQKGTWMLVKSCVEYGISFERSKALNKSVKKALESEATSDHDRALLKEYSCEDSGQLFRELFGQFAAEFGHSDGTVLRRKLTRFLKIHAEEAKAFLLETLAASQDEVQLSAVCQIYFDSPIIFTNVYYHLVLIMLKRCHELLASAPLHDKQIRLCDLYLSTLSHILATNNFNVTSAEAASCLATCIQFVPHISSSLRSMTHVANVVGAILKHRTSNVPKMFQLVQKLLYVIISAAFDMPELCDAVCKVLCLLATSKLHSKLKLLYLAVLEYFFILAGEKSMNDTLKQVVLPGLFSIMDVCTEKAVLRLSLRMTDAEKLIFTEVRDTYKKRFRYTGQ